LFSLFSFPPFLCLALLFGCCSSNPFLQEGSARATQEANTPNLERLRHSYLHLRRRIFVRVCGVRSDGDTDCVDTTPSRASASAIAYNRDDERTYVLTAGHACENRQPMTIFDYIFNTPQEQEVAEKLADFVDIRTMEKVTELELQTINGDRFLEDVAVVEVDRESDLCVLSIPAEPSIPVVEIAEAEPVVGSTVWNIASPYGIFGQGMVPILSGIWCGRAPSESTFICDLPASPGSSGSGVFNSEGQIVSIVLATNMQFHHASFGANLEQIRNIID